MATKYWRNAASGAWATAGNWSLSSGGPANTTVPGAADDVIFDQNATYTVTFATSLNIGLSVSFLAGIVTFSHGIYNVQSRTWNISAGARLNHTFSSGYVLCGDGGSNAGTYNNNGTVVITATTTTTCYMQYGGTFNNNTGASFSITNTAVNGTQFYLLAAPTSGCDFNNAGTFTATNNGQQSAGVVFLSGNYNNTGTVTWNYPNAAVTTGIHFYCAKNTTILLGSTTFNMGVNTSTAGSPGIIFGTTTAGFTTTLLDNFTTPRLVTMFSNVLNLNGKTLTCPAFNIPNNTYTKGITWNGGSIYLTGSSVAFQNSVSSLNVGTMTLAAGTGNGYIVFTNAAAKTLGNTTQTWTYPCILGNSGGTLAVNKSTYGGLVAFSSGATFNINDTTPISITNPGIIGDGTPIALISGSGIYTATISWVGSGNPSINPAYTLTRIILFASGTYYNSFCTGYDLYSTYSNGAGGTTTSLTQTNNVATCGYVPPATYSVASAVGNINEGNNLTINATTTNVADGTTLYWTINHVTTSDADFSAVSGSFTITSGAGSFIVTPTPDAITEGPETFTVSIRTVSVSGTVVATTGSTTVNDTSAALASTAFFMFF
jgi:hypothetical protein